LITPVNQRTERSLGRVAAEANISREDLREAIENAVDEYLGLLPRERYEQPERRTGARLVYGAGHQAMSFVADPEGTDVVPQGHEPPPGYFGP
jgi:hypothetical protein